MIQKGVAVIPRSVTQKRIEQNFQIFDFELSNLEIHVIGQLNQNRHLGEGLSHIE
ncbi:MAG: hypothetical protein Alis3KO_15540 [Aliiglaciecola sp.]